MKSINSAGIKYGLSDLLNYAHLIDEGVIINKDGAFLLSYKFRGPDMYSASLQELDSLTATFNRMVTYLEDGWMLHIDELRVPSLTYPAQGSFPDSVSKLIDEECRQFYEAAGSHYENYQFLTFVWKFPLSVVKTMRHLFVENLKNEDDANLSTLLNQFYEKVERCVSLISTQFFLEKLSSMDLLSYLNTCISGELLPVAVPPDGCFIDVALARHTLTGGYLPRIGDNYIYVLSILGYLNEETVPGLLDKMGTYPLIYRWSSRFIALSETTAEREIKRYQRNWNNKVKGFAGVMKEAVFGRPAQKVNLAALQMSQQTTEALRINGSKNTCFGHWSSAVVIMNESTALLDQAVKDIRSYLEQCGFSCIKEDVNAVDAWIGSIPGHGSCNMRRLFINSLNLAHVLPLHTLWAGDQYSSDDSLLPQHSPPVFYAATAGKTPFRFHLDVADVGHQVVLGPTGSGKSTYLGFLVAQFLRYQGAQIYIFDKDYSHQALTSSLDGVHYDLGNGDELSFCPLADLSTESKRIRAITFIEDLVMLQNVAITPDIRAAIHLAITTLSLEVNPQSRNLTVFKSLVQHELVRSAIHYYTIEGPLKILDATSDSLQSRHLHTFEMNWLLGQNEAICVPVLRYIFDQIESRLERAGGEKPTLIVLEEAWLYITHKMFAEKLKDWLKTLRKKNARVVFATQSLADLYDPSTKSLTKTTAAIMESCPTKIYLANPSMEAEMSELYYKIGLSERQVQIISQIAIPKNHYYVVTKEGNRLIEFSFRERKSIALLFVGLSRERGRLLLMCKEKYKEEWVYFWLMQHGYEKWAEYWRMNFGGQTAE